MESPKVYRGYNNEGNCLITKTAVDANTQINPADVKAAIDNIKTVFDEQMKMLASALTDVSTNAEEAIIVEGTSMGPAIEEVATVLMSLSEKLTSGFDDLYDKAVTAHDEQQRRNNTEAYNACAISGVTRIA